MGLAVDGARVALGTCNAIWFLRNAPDIAPQRDAAKSHDACFVPRQCHITGDILGHKMFWGEAGLNGSASGGADATRELWVVNTRFSRLCTLHPDYSFAPRWQPRFVSDLVAQDRCHLNGLALVDGKPRYVAALAQTNERRG